MARMTPAVHAATMILAHTRAARQIDTSVEPDRFLFHMGRAELWLRRYRQYPGRAPRVDIFVDDLKDGLEWGS